MDKSTKIGLVVVAFSLLGVLLLCGALEVFGQLLQSSQPVEDKSDGITACLMANKFVEQRLKAPSTAKFQSCADAVTNHEYLSKANDNYRVMSYVDSENSFGAMLRLNYVVVVRYDGNHEWSLVSMETGQD